MNFKLSKGDKIGILAPSGPVRDKEGFSKTVEMLKKFGYRIKIYKSCTEENYSDRQKILDMISAFSDSSIKAIICARGGYGTLRLLDSMNYNIVASNPKIFAGCSDITNLLLTFYKRSALECFHSPMIVGNGCFNEKSWRDFVKTVNGKKKEILPKYSAKTIREGSAEGILWGGNLSTLVSLFGSWHGEYISSKNIILFLEDLNEPCYKIDKMLTQITRNSMLSRKIRGVIFGDFLEVDSKEELLASMKRFADKLNVPCVFGYNITHLKSNTTVKIGQYVKFDTEDRIIKFIKGEI